MEIGQRERRADQPCLVGGQSLERVEDAGCCGQTLRHLVLVSRAAGARAEDVVGEDLPHQRPVRIGIDHAHDLVHAAERPGIGRLQGRVGKGTVDVADDGAGLVEHISVVHEGGHAAEGMEGEVGGRPVGGEGIDLDLLVGQPLLLEGQTGDPVVDAVAVAVQDEGHGAS